MSFKKNLAEHPKGAEEKRKFTAVHQELIGSIRKGCELMGAARSTFYYKPKEKSLQKLKEDLNLQDEMERACCEFPRYGYRAVTKELYRRGWTVNHKKVYRIMRDNDLLCRIRKRRVKATNSSHSHPTFPNLIKACIYKSNLDS